MVLLVGLFAACSDKDVTYDMDKANDATKAYIQLFNMAPIANNAANYAYQIDINGYEYICIETSNATHIIKASSSIRAHSS